MVGEKSMSNEMDVGGSESEARAKFIHAKHSINATSCVSLFLLPIANIQPSVHRQRNSGGNTAERKL